MMKMGVWVLRLEIALETVISFSAPSLMMEMVVGEEGEEEGEEVKVHGELSGGWMEEEEEAESWRRIMEYSFAWLGMLVST